VREEEEKRESKQAKSLIIPTFGDFEAPQDRDRAKGQEEPRHQMD
jgi:hypothetical protein